MERKRIEDHIETIVRLKKNTHNMPQFITALEVHGYDVAYTEHGILNVLGYKACRCHFNIKITENLSLAGKAFHVEIPNEYIKN